MNRREKLLLAAQLLDEVRAEMNTKSDTCPCCSLSKKENWSEAQLADALKEAVKKIHRYAGLVQV